MLYEDIEYIIQFEKEYCGEYSLVDVKNIKRETYWCKNDEQYIKHTIEKLKDNVIRKYPDLSKIKVLLNILDKNNILHKLIVCSINMLRTKLNILNKPNLYKTIFIIVLYDNQTVFLGSIEFI